jgi:hypothetical protein
MTENEKLRALLAEALTWMRECDCHTKLLSPKDDAFLARIDAALAEPLRPAVATYPWVADENEKIHQRDAERVVDEARAEVERLKQEVRIAKHTVDMRTVKQQMKRNREAFQRGAEAMREAAAKEMLRLRNRYNERINTMQIIGAEVSDHLGIAREEAGCHMDIIRALPLPEDKP